MNTTPGTKIIISFGVEHLSGTVTESHDGWIMVKIDDDQVIMSGREISIMV